MANSCTSVCVWGVWGGGGGGVTFMMMLYLVAGAQTPFIIKRLLISILITSIDYLYQIKFYNIYLQNYVFSISWEVGHNFYFLQKGWSPFLLQVHWGEGLKNHIYMHASKCNIHRHLLVKNLALKVSHHFPVYCYKPLLWGH